MYKIALHRLGHSALLIFGVVTVIFFTNFMIGDPVRVMLPASTPPEAVEEFRRQMGFDRPIFVQYWDFISKAIFLDFEANWGLGRWAQPAWAWEFLHPMDLIIECFDRNENFQK